MANDEFNKLKQQVEELQKKVDNLTAANNIPFKGSLDDVQVERVFNADTSGTPATNGLLHTYTDSNLDTVVALNYPSRIMVYTWKGQRLAIPVYDITTLILP